MEERIVNGYRETGTGVSRRPVRRPGWVGRRHAELEPGSGAAVGCELSRRHRPLELLVRGLLFASAFVCVLVTAGIAAILVNESIPFFADPAVNLWRFFTTTRWQPQIDEFGILPLLSATLLTSLIALLVAVPLGIVVAVYLSEYATPRVRNILKPVLEILAGIPTIVYGYFALTFVTPLLRSVFGDGVVEIYNTASAGLVMGILILPLIASLSEDALASVPQSQRSAALGLGATKIETTIHVVIPAAFSGLAAAFIIGLSRAVGETMIVSLAAGSGPAFTLDPFRAAETLTGYIVRISGGDVGYDTVDYTSIFALGLVLFAITFLLNLASRKIVKRFREVYE